MFNDEYAPITEPSEIEQLKADDANKAKMIYELSKGVKQLQKENEELKEALKEHKEYVEYLFTNFERHTNGIKYFLNYGIKNFDK